MSIPMMPLAFDTFPEFKELFRMRCLAKSTRMGPYMEAGIAPNNPGVAADVIEGLTGDALRNAYKEWERSTTQYENFVSDKMYLLMDLVSAVNKHPEISNTMKSNPATGSNIATGKLREYYSDLCLVCEGRSNNQIYATLNEFMNMRCPDEKDYFEFAGRFMTLAAQYEKLATRPDFAAVSSTVIFVQALKHLPGFSHILNTATLGKEVWPNYREFHTQLSNLRTNERLATTLGKFSSSMSANIAKSPHSSKSSDKSSPFIICFNCGGKGHVSTDCTEEKATCRRCGKRHHTSVHDLAIAHSDRTKTSFESPQYRSKDDSGGNRSESADKVGRPGKLSSSPTKRKSPKVYSRRQLAHMLEMQDDFQAAGTPVDTAFIVTCLDKKGNEFVLEPTMLFVQPGEDEYEELEEVQDEESYANYDYGNETFILTFDDNLESSNALAVSSSSSTSPLAIFDTGCNGAHSVPSMSFLEPNSVIEYPNFSVTGANGPIRPRAIGNLRGSNQRAIVLESCKVILISPSEFLSGIGGGTFVGDEKSLVVYDRKKKPRLRCDIEDTPTAARNTS